MTRTEFFQSFENATGLQLTNVRFKSNCVLFWMTLYNTPGWIPAETKSLYSAAHLRAAIEAVKGANE